MPSTAMDFAASRQRWTCTGLELLTVLTCWHATSISASHTFAKASEASQSPGSGALAPRSKSAPRGPPLEAARRGPAPRSELRCLGFRELHTRSKGGREKCVFCRSLDLWTWQELLTTKPRRCLMAARAQLDVAESAVVPDIGQRLTSSGGSGSGPAGARRHSQALFSLPCLCRLFVHQFP